MVITSTTTSTMDTMDWDTSLLLLRAVPLPSLPTSSPLLWLLVGLASHLLSSLLLLPPTPTSALSSKFKAWKWQSTYVARMSAGLTGAWALLALYTSPSMRADLMLTSSTSATCLVAFSIGIHSAEALDMLWQKQPSMLLVHHVFVILCFAGALFTGKAVGFAVLSLVTEVNTIFNKTRILHLITGLARSSEEFQQNAQVNLATFLVRMAIVAWMNHQATLYYGLIPTPFLVTCGLGLFIVNIWNISVFRRLCAADLNMMRKAKTA